MAKLILHIGAHETDATGLQDILFHNRDMLAAHGVHYPDIGPNRAHHVLVGPWIDMSASYYGRGGPDGMWRQFVDTYAAKPGTVFLSAEPFSRAEPQRVDMADLRERLSGFEDVRLVYTVRQQSELIQSIWLQVAKEGKAGHLPNFLTAALKTRLATGVPVDHGMVYDHMLAGFRPEQITFLDYEQIRRAPGGVLQAFLDLIGGGLRADQLAPVSNNQANISPDPLGMYIYGRIAPGETPVPEELARVVAALKKGRPLPTTIYTRADYAQVCKVFAPLNAAFVARVQAHQPGFTMTGELEAPEFTFRDMLNQQDWGRIAAAIYAAR